MRTFNIVYVWSDGSACFMWKVYDEENILVTATSDALYLETWRKKILEHYDNQVFFNEDV